ncbi:hypothetical protein B5M42_002310 [Paenibacillus athensensis]|uniref:Uncharacterized protein n=1 Tax=Paenibacillus athensensis TaxID=1967502 RepID=A0A4Y8QA99_9BACL|nr:hypothetical protein [Paenibacillus athensensis]MCD1257672.1 hypothetical protein [Paenibacillus athensensis]
MKKKWIVLGGALGLSSIVMVATGIGAMASASGYDAYKSALKTTKSLQNVTIQASAALQDNAKALANASGEFKVDTSNDSASGHADFTVNGAQQSVSFYKQAKQTVLKAGYSDVYYVEQEGKGKRDKAENPADAQFSAQIETVIDALVGNLKDYVAVNPQTDGSKEISLQLTNPQIPAVVNAIAPIVIKEVTKQEHDGEQNDDQEKGQLPFKEDIFKDALPQLTQDIKIEQVTVKAKLNTTNYIEHQEADLTVSGKDDGGTVHQVTLHVQADLSKYNSTTPDTIDLTGKTVQTLAKHGHGHGHNEDSESTEN